MSVRDFTDQNGKPWRAWDIKPDAIHPKTKAEDYLAECYDVGWIVFEAADASEKRRLCPYPKRWSEASELELCEMLARADVVPAHKLASEKALGGDIAATIHIEVGADASTHGSPDVTDLEVVRSFRYPGGRIWTVCVARDDPSSLPVLRFTAGMRSIDRKTWPKDWADATEDSLAHLLRTAWPRAAREPAEGVPRRRWNDQQPS